MNILEVKVDDRVRFSKRDDVYEFKVKYVGDDTYPYVDNSSGMRFYADSGWKIELLDRPVAEEPESGLGTLVSVYDTALGRYTVLVKVRVDGDVRCRWADVQNAKGYVFTWDFWMRDARPGSVKVLYTAAE